MRQFRPHSQLAIVIFISAGFILLSCLFGDTEILIEVHSQSGCPTLNPGSIPSWPQGAEVTVYIDSSYNENQTNAIKAAFTNWENSRGANGNNSGVTFTFSSTQGSGNHPFTVLMDSAPVSGVRAEVTNFSIS